MVAEAAGNGSGIGSCGVVGVVHGSHPALNAVGPCGMPGAGVGSATSHSSASTAWCASRMQAGTPTPRNAAPAIASPGTALTAVRIPSTRSW